MNSIRRSRRASCYSSRPSTRRAPRWPATMSACRTDPSEEIFGRPAQAGLALRVSSGSSQTGGKPAPELMRPRATPRCLAPAGNRAISPISDPLWKELRHDCRTVKLLAAKGKRGRIETVETYPNRGFSRSGGAARWIVARKGFELFDQRLKLARNGSVLPEERCRRGRQGVRCEPAVPSTIPPKARLRPRLAI